MILSLCQNTDKRLSGLNEEIRNEVNFASNEKMGDLEGRVDDRCESLSNR